jgi:hypothetical protein
MVPENSMTDQIGQAFLALLGSAFGCYGIRELVMRVASTR